MCDFLAQRGRRDLSGHSEPRVLRRHLLAGQLFQPNTKLALTDLAHARKARTLQTHRQEGHHIPRAAPRGAFKPLSPGWYLVWTLV